MERVLEKVCGLSGLLGCETAGPPGLACFQPRPLAARGCLDWEANLALKRTVAASKCPLK